MTEREIRRVGTPADPTTPIAGSEATLLDFWQWGFSDLVSNDVRGTLGEFLVALALGVTDQLPISWAGYDLAYEGRKIEVKTSGLWQAWGTLTNESKLTWGIGRSLGWDPETNAYPESPVRAADVYVFARWTGASHEPIAPLDTADWDFTVVATNVLETEFGDRTTLSDSHRRRLIAEGRASLTDFADLAMTIRDVLGMP